MQRQMSFLERPLPDGTAPVWAEIDKQQRDEVVATLARLIAKVAAARSTAPAVDSEEKEEKGHE